MPRRSERCCPTPASRGYSGRASRSLPARKTISATTHRAEGSFTSMRTTSLSLVTIAPRTTGFPSNERFLIRRSGVGFSGCLPPELEYVVLLIRMVLKYAIWDEVLWQGLRGRSAGLKASEQEELAYLESCVNLDRVSDVVREHTPWLGEGLLDACAAVARGEVSLRERLHTGRRLHRQLAAHARHRETADGTLRLARRVIVALQRRVGLLPRFRLANGGAMVAVIGGDGSGKSTAVAELGAWLGGEFEVRRIHLGKPPWSVTTYGVRGAFKVATLARNVLGRARHGTLPSGTESEPAHRAVAWLACTARDRYLAYRKARRFADRGGLVVSDRYPHPALQSMDVPLISRIEAPQPSSWLASTLERLEHRYHERIELPEVLIVLQVDPDTAARRKTDEPTDYVKRRVAEVWEIDWEAASVPVVDARRPKEEVVAELKSLIWDALA